MPAPGEVFDGYTLVRRIGEGGFGQVWLCRSAATGDLFALKIIPGFDGSALDKELSALMRYRRVAARLAGAPVTPVEHANLTPEGLFYTMPLADGDTAGVSPESPDWRPRSLATVLEQRRQGGDWLTSHEIRELMKPILAGLQSLCDAGLVHRDIKPENILFFSGKPHLGDISLLTQDRTQLTRHGTPGYSTPSWYTGGHHDMYGAATLLYTLLTGNAPDKMGRAAFLWPPRGEKSLSATERKAWLRLHAVVRRAAEEKPGERFPDFNAMSAACDDGGGSATTARRATPGVLRKVAYGLVALSIPAGLFFGIPWEKESRETSGVRERIGSLLEENDRLGREYHQQLNGFLAFYEEKAPSVLREMELLAADTVGAEEFDRRLAVIETGLGELVRPEIDMRDDPLTPLPRDEYVRRLKAARKSYDQNPDAPPATLASANARATLRLTDLYEEAQKLPRNAEEQFWFERNASARFYASPKRAGGVDMLPMDTAWRVRAHRGGVIYPLAEGRVLKLLGELAKAAGKLAEKDAWPEEIQRRVVDRFVKIKNSGAWIQLQVGCFALPPGSRSQTDTTPATTEGA